MKRLLRTTLSELAYRAIRMTDGHHTGLRLLTYHRVTDAHPQDRLCVGVSRFAEQMRYLSEAGFKTVSFAQAVQWVRGHNRPAPKSIVLTFDDGFEDNYLCAASAMAPYGFRGCFFVPSAFVESGAPGCEPDDRPMSVAQLEELLRQGHEIGAHSVTHVKLTTVPQARMVEEVRDSKAALEQALRRPVDFFCYPAGDYDEAVRRAVCESGYHGACTVEPGANVPGDDPFTLKRTEISAEDSMRDFERKLAGAYDWLHRAVQWSKS